MEFLSHGKYKNGPTCRTNIFGEYCCPAQTKNHGPHKCLPFLLSEHAQSIVRKMTKYSLSSRPEIPGTYRL